MAQQRRLIPTLMAHHDRNVRGGEHRAILRVDAQSNGGDPSATVVANLDIVRLSEIAWRNVKLSACIRNESLRDVNARKYHQRSRRTGVNIRMRHLQLHPATIWDRAVARYPVHTGWRAPSVSHSLVR